MSLIYPSSAAWSAGPDGWLAIVERVNWHTAGAAAVHGLLALLALGVARTAMPHRALAWRQGAIALLVLALVQLCALDLLFVEVARTVARAGGWYQDRRKLQSLFLVVLLLGGLVVAWRRAVEPAAVRPRRGLLAAQAARPPEGDAWLRTGMGLLLVVAVLRFVSLHATDQWLGWRIEGVSLGRWIEAVGLTIVALRAGWLLRTEAPGTGG